MKEKEFNLLHEHWIAVMNENGDHEEVGLIDVFRRAHEIKMLSGELPTQDIAILRLLLAVLYAVFLRKDVNGVPAEINDEYEAIERWRSLWDLGHFPSDIIEAYLKEYEERFYLIHPDRPFYQVNFAKGSEYKVSKLNGEISQSGNKEALFSPKGGKDKEDITLAEATRWLIHVNAFDDSSGKPTVRGGNMPSTGVGWLAKLGVVYVSGRTLFETLMLNFITWDKNNNDPFPDGKAAWELEVPRSEERVEVKVPDEPIGLLTFQSRRLHLSFDGTRITGYKLLGGDVFSKENAFIEPMTLWKKEKKGSEIYIPKIHDPAKALWRDLFSLLARTEKEEYLSGAVKWIIGIRPYISNKQVVFRSVGIQYGDKNSSIENVFGDNVAVSTHLLEKKGLDIFVPRIISVIGVTDDCVKKYGMFAAYVEKASGRDKKRLMEVSEAAREDMFFELDLPFRSWLAGINPEIDDIDQKSREWIGIMKKILFDRGENMVAEAGDKALVGTSIKNNAFSALLNFKSTVKKIIGGYQNE